MNKKLLSIGEYVLVAALVVASTYFLGAKVLTNEFLLPMQASEQAVVIDELFGIHWWLIAFFFSLIVVFMLYSVFRSFIVHGLRPKREGFGEYMEGNARLEVVWTVVPLALVVWIAFLGADSLGKVERRYAGPVEINVIGTQWSWRFEYPTEEGVSVVSDKLYLPVDKPVVLHLQSTDVIHSFWVPEFRVKQDVLPGGEAFTRDLRITATEIGAYKVRCAELCGESHWSMQADVQVVSEAEYEAWLVQAGEDCGDEAVACGQRWATQFGCVSCHQAADGPIVPTTGPTWLELFGSVVSLDDGSTVTADETYILNSILDPNSQIHAGFRPDVMPKNFGELLTEEQINQIIEFIKSLGQ
ncbi:MAG: cytochrome c oxidase subunit II [Chloroflexi bacterium]|nr:cytochrome c oxidase subunit II [Chloroflexota bacterium]